MIWIKLLIKNELEVKHKMYGAGRTKGKERSEKEEGWRREGDRGEEAEEQGREDRGTGREGSPEAEEEDKEERKGKEAAQKGWVSLQPVDLQAGSLQLSRDTWHLNSTVSQWSTNLGHGASLKFRKENSSPIAEHVPKTCYLSGSLDISHPRESFQPLLIFIGLASDKYCASGFKMKFNRMNPKHNQRTHVVSESLDGSLCVCRSFVPKNS